LPRYRDSCARQHPIDPKTAKIRLSFAHINPLYRIVRVVENKVALSTLLCPLLTRMNKSINIKSYASAHIVTLQAIAFSIVLVAHCQNIIRDTCHQPSISRWVKSPVLAHVRGFLAHREDVVLVMVFFVDLLPSRRFFFLEIISSV
jgi:hypothetical protein